MEVNPTVVTVFSGGRKLFKNVKIALEDDQLIVVNKITNRDKSYAVLGRFTVAEVAKSPTTEGLYNAAFDVTDPTGERVRVIVQSGCGCGGMRSYTTDPGYSGAIQHI